MLSTRKWVYRVVVADDHVQYRDFLQDFFSKQSELEITGEAGDGLELLELLSQIDPLPQMAIIDISMPRMGGIEATASIKRLYPDMKVLILSAHREEEYVRSALAAGADGYLLKDAAYSNLSMAIEKIKQNEVYLPQFFMEVQEEKEEGPTN